MKWLNGGTHPLSKSTRAGQARNRPDPTEETHGIIEMMKNKEASKNTLHVARTIAGTLIASAGFILFVLSAMVGVIEPTRLNIVISITLLIVGLLIANSVAVARFLNDQV
jgi:hypothetical protein